MQEQCTVSNFPLMFFHRENSTHQMSNYWKGKQTSAFRAMKNSLDGPKYT